MRCRRRDHNVLIFIFASVIIKWSGESIIAIIGP